MSCIPTGIYKVAIHRSPKHGISLRFIEVPGRSEILFHRGNTTADTQGCILVGLWFSKIGEREAISLSANGMQIFAGYFKSELGELEVEII